MSDGRRERLRVHLTLLDVSDATIARDLCIFMLLDELNKTTDTTKRMEIKATLMYAFSAPVMPPYCAQRWAPWFPTIYIDHSLSSQVEEFIRRHLQTPHYQSSRAPPWIHVPPESVPALLKVLDFWLTTSRSTHHTLAIHEIPQRSGQPQPTFRPGAQQHLQEILEHNMADKRAQIRASLLNMSDIKLAELFPGASPAGGGYLAEYAGGEKLAYL